MNISYDWLKEYLDLTVLPEELAKYFDQIGLMIESIKKVNGDTVYEIETYANRPDTLGHLGVARELATLLGLPLKTPSWPLNELDQATFDLVDIQVLDSQLCPRYCGLVVKSVMVGPSPEWLKRRIEACGLRPINNVVDISNYVCFSLGQPLHTFDFGRLREARIIVRRARKGETLLTLDGQLVELTPDMLVIADESKPVALAGIIGGEESAITEKTTDVFIESANFDPVSIRLTAKKLGLTTDASYRFERGVDINTAPLGAMMAASLLSRCGGKASRGLIDVYPSQRKPKSVPLRLKRIAELLGIEIPEEFVVRTLTALGLKLNEQKPGVWVAEIPSFRVDLEREADLIEEIARFFGYDHIPSEVTPARSFELPASQEQDCLWFLKEILFHYGFDEVINFSFADQQKETIWQTGYQPIKLQNPISSRASILRTSILPGLVENAVWNYNREAEGVHIFETGKIYFWEEDGKQREEWHLGLITSGLKEGKAWNQPSRETDYFFLKGAIEDLFSYLGYDVPSFEPEDHSFFQSGQSVKISIKNEPIGYLGLLKPETRKAYELEKLAYGGELNLTALFGRQPRAFTFTAVPRYPGTVRDLSFQVEAQINFQDIYSQLRKLNVPFLERFEIYDRFEGGSLAPGQVSYSVRFFFRHESRTLLTEEVDRAMLNIISQLKSTLKIQLR
ncbi:MAG TPA: phenylalanine--tRNA ligase subunit beta [Candidatus Saccharicenans sp.]|jgi:phenylalanyl-tRNA synthetase beta chain|nr:phenylalanine--tRNA ligase subunit beta [Candidatus Saccharicenans sp.]HRD02871.1 phenylalanine--tRNA ligase subunit beta [Candidatus Saccharicenans sp.]